MKGRKGRQVEANSKFEIPNPKQIQMSKTPNPKTNSDAEVLDFTAERQRSDSWRE
jgi:hypothetical protein